MARGVWAYNLKKSPYRDRLESHAVKYHHYTISSKDNHPVCKIILDSKCCFFRLKIKSYSVFNVILQHGVKFPIRRRK